MAMACKDRELSPVWKDTRTKIIVLDAKQAGQHQIQAEYL